VGVRRRDRQVDRGVRWNIYQPTGHSRREILNDDPVSWVLNTRANADMTAIAFKEAMLFMAIPFGNSYAEIVLNKAGRVAELWPLESERVTPRRDLQSNALYYEYRQPDGTLSRLESKQVFHLRGPSITGLVGENVVARAAKSLSVAAAAERFSASFFGRGAHPSGVLEYPGKLDEETYERLKRDWAERKQGPENAHKPMILEAGMKWSSVSLEPEKSQLVESRQFAVEEICRWFGVPPHKVQHLLRSTFSNIEHQSIEFVRDALTPWARRLEQEADFKLFRQDRAPFKETSIDLTPLTYGDASSRANAQAVWRQNGILTANEIRHREGLNDIGPDGDVLLVQANLTTVERILEAPPGGAAVSPTKSPTPGEEPAESEPKSDDAAVDAARTGVTLLMSSALERYLRRMKNRASDIAGKLTAQAFHAHLAEERERVWPSLTAELVVRARSLSLIAFGRELHEDEVRHAMELVDRGEPPAIAASKILSAIGPKVAA
jgi:HK97 family phage portal protein